MPQVTDGERASGARLPQRLWRLVAEGGARRVRSVVRRVFGAPDYDAYLDHCRAAGHPPRLTEREYVAEFFESKGKGVRCC